MIEIEQLEYGIGNFRLGPVDLTIREGEYFVLLGPPGSGKSMLIECLCGLRQPRHGRIRLHGKDITRTEPRRRRIGYVPQDYGLFPHLSVAQNIGFGLRGREDARDQVRKIAGVLHIVHLLDRRIRGLSGGERQYVALARALALEPACLLLDEPVSALDEATRQEVCRQLKDLQQSLGISTVHISHNREEAFSVADRAAILRDGVLQQAGLMPELARKPVNEYVARFMRCENMLRGDAQESLFRIGNLTLTLPDSFRGPVLCVIRPESIRFEDTTEVNRLVVRIAQISDRGAYCRLVLVGPVELIAHVPPELPNELDLKPGQTIKVSLPPDAIHVLLGDEKQS
jgi:ABC-type Fe3+/spermidine/putrescine transport system ATPase subunit